MEYGPPSENAKSVSVTSGVTSAFNASYTLRHRIALNE